MKRLISLSAAETEAKGSISMFTDVLLKILLTVGELENHTGAATVGCRIEVVTSLKKSFLNFYFTYLANALLLSYRMKP